MTELFWSEDYCYFLDFLQIVYYPITNHITSRVNGPRFPKISRQLISSLGHIEAREITSLYINKLQHLYNQSHIPDYIIYRNKNQFSGEESFLHYMVFNNLGETKLKLRKNMLMVIQDSLLILFI